MNEVQLDVCVWRFVEQEAGRGGCRISTERGERGWEGRRVVVVVVVVVGDEVGEVQQETTAEGRRGGPGYGAWAVPGARRRLGGVASTCREAGLGGWVGSFLVENILHCIVVVVVAAVYTDGVCTGCGGSGWGAVEEVDWVVCARNWVGGVWVRVRRQWNDSTSKRINSTFNSSQNLPLPTCSSIKRHEACVRPNQAPAGRH